MPPPWLLYGRECLRQGLQEDEEEEVCPGLSLQRGALQVLHQKGCRILQQMQVIYTVLINRPCIYKFENTILQYINPFWPSLLTQHSKQYFVSFTGFAVPWACAAILVSTQ